VLAERKYQRAYTQFRLKLRQAREEAGLTQVEVAKALGKAQSFVSKMESGERRVDVVELRAIATLYGKTVSYFLGS